MNRLTITPESRDAWLSMRSEDLTSTEISALFGLSPYMTLFELWHHKFNRTTSEIEDNDRMKWGIRLEPAIAQGIADDNLWVIHQFKDYMRVPELRIGSSFDYAIEPGASNPEPGLLEIKNVDFIQHRDTWEDDEAPPHIELQFQHQLLVSGLKWGAISCLVAGNTPYVIEREADEKIQAEILTRTAAFWKSVDDNTPPEPIYKDDGDFIRKLYGKSRAESFADLSTDEKLYAACERQKEGASLEKTGKELKEAATAEILSIIKDTEKVKCSDYNISAGMVDGTQINYYREPYRMVRINKIKPKKG